LNIQVKAMVFSPAQMKESGAGNHGCIIGTKLDGWITEADSEREQFLLKACTQTEISRHTTG